MRALVDREIANVREMLVVNMAGYDVQADPRRLLDAVQVQVLTNQSPSTLWRRIKAGTFPAPDMVLSQHRYWFYQSVIQWQDSLSIKAAISE